MVIEINGDMYSNCNKSSCQMVINIRIMCHKKHFSKAYVVVIPNEVRGTDISSFFAI